MIHRVDLLAFGPHPDDIEIGIGGVVARHVRQGAVVGLCDLTRGELGTNGTVEERLAEADEAARLLGVAWRRNLGWPDGDITLAADRILAAVEMIRECRPRAVAAPYWDDRHPDHRAASEAIRRAVFNSGLRRYAAAGEPWRPEWIAYYFINDSAAPSFVVDVSDDYEMKRRALDCYRSQFQPASGLPTRLTSPRFRQLIESRDAQFGALAGVAFAEGVIVREPIVREGLFR
jgi:bacillithiol biosynthesis deacetylase BshB1